MCFTPQMELTRVGDEKTESFSSSLNFLAERNHFEKKKKWGGRKKSNKTQTHQSRAKYKLYLVTLSFSILPTRDELMLKVRSVTVYMKIKTM